MIINYYLAKSVYNERNNMSEEVILTSCQCPISRIHATGTWQFVCLYKLITLRALHAVSLGYSFQ